MREFFRGWRRKAGFGSKNNGNVAIVFDDMPADTGGTDVRSTFLPVPVDHRTDECRVDHGNADV